MNEMVVFLYRTSIVSFFFSFLLGLVIPYLIGTWARYNIFLLLRSCCNHRQCPTGFHQLWTQRMKEQMITYFFVDAPHFHAYYSKYLWKHCSWLPMCQPPPQYHLSPHPANANNKYEWFTHDHRQITFTNHTMKTKLIWLKMHFVFLNFWQNHFHCVQQK